VFYQAESTHHSRARQQTRPDKDPNLIQALAADDGHLAFITDRLGLVGYPAPERVGAEPDTVAALLGHLPLLRLTTDHVTTDAAKQIWAQLRCLLEKDPSS
jgi:hypothetical protein